MNRRDFLTATACTAFAFSGSWSSGVARADDDIILGAAVPLTGPFSLSGRIYYDALQVAQDDLNAKGGIGGRKTKIIFEDTQSSNTGAINAFVKLYQEYRPSLMFLSSYSTQNVATSPEILKAEIPVFYAGGARTVSALNNKWMFRIRPEDALAAIGMAEYAKDGLSKSKPGVLFIQNDFGQGAAGLAIEAFKRQGIEPVGSEAYGGNDKDMSAQLLSLKAKGADSLLLFCYAVDAALIVQQVKQLGLGIPIVASSGLFLPTTANLLSPSDYQNVWGVTDGVLDDSAGGPVKEFMDKYKARFKRDADPYAAAYYDAAMIASDGISKVGADPSKLRDYIAGLQGYKGLAHVYSFDSARDGVHSVAVVKMKPSSKQIELVKEITPSLP
ncbi:MULTISPECIES: ABC transporter substrate-binding protein [Bradyrhizobium]|uniref:ABC transporter substrate-binding protein n=1 Tax=Bradyrhizobium TaxID=374 RepID=UPI0004298BC1|nr:MULTISPECIES: ABC transporter substrate-binding protein [Bradyrhizobium]UFW51172.1 ABC transporter substrate-binding protein [Bradyrhizobium arachidis]